MNKIFRYSLILLAITAILGSGILLVLMCKSSQENNELSLNVEIKDSNYSSMTTIAKRKLILMINIQL